MASPITFGIELEFNIAYLYEGQKMPDPNETRQIFFPITSEAEESVKRGYEEEWGTDIPRHFSAMLKELPLVKSLQYEVRDTLISLGCTVTEPRVFGGDPAAWEVSHDDSIRPTDGTGYNWFGMEINSPALLFTPASLDLIVKVCTTITEKYLTDPNATCGVHVHLSAGKTTLEFRTMQKLFVFLWSFEHQMSSLHPEERQTNDYCRSLRVQSRLVDDFCERWGEAPSILQGIIEFNNCEDMLSLLRLAECFQQSRYMAFNCSNALNTVQNPNQSSKPTIEFRQHAGTLDGERLVNWVKLIAGLVHRLETIHPDSLSELLKLVEFETWEKTRNEKHNKIFQKAEGSIPAESALTIIDLLEYLGLKESADYYRDRLFEVAGRDTRYRPDVFNWNGIAHEESRGSDTSVEALEAEKAGMMKVFQSIMLVGAASEEEDGGRLNFNSTDQLWSLITREDGEQHERSGFYAPHPFR
ncbi:hypothetical protein VTL71DRAFT_218 [Oculimacula yallundae]|uniref:Amidoligase enzyme n=1 Tax=Oculimacula yallundae TaxID=86028 RepID=A0ABR4CZI1_9HELO